MVEFIKNLFSQEFMPHGHCLFWKTEMIRLYVIADSLTVIAYYSIPIAIIYFVSKRKDIVFKWVFVLFAAFIILCGTTHLMFIWTLWNPMYRLEAVIKLLTGIVSVITAIVLWPIIPKTLALPSPTQLRKVNKELIQEIDNRKLTEKQLHEFALQLESQNVRLKELDRLKSMFIASMSHELRTPLNAIIGFTGMTLMGLSGELNKEQKDNIERANRSSKHLFALISNIIDISKIEAGVVETHCSPFFLHEITDEAISSVQYLLKGKNISLEVNVPEGIGLNTDRKRLLQCLVNLLSNAAKYTDAGKIVVSSKVVGENVELSVTDTGLGIPEKDFSKVFVAFERLKTRLAVKGGGTGLGLYLTKKITNEILKGIIEVESREGVGSTFRLRVPMILNVKKSE